ncbi:Os08g0216300 [Oryza sativa Japonica Group]|jgi:hypothetical protein|uniref:Os08g0214233 protein n=2 Tax=Oryza sativa subsp. japonica TaxID=39947 RepID=C7J668_ORYSJ|nr:hypothetical protein EE612_042781 [Oryza sativa]BAH94166.1 Os08g0214233 [Oryza sativa Japonica Group]BAT04337.1 Os08g0214233 [Oryza sativa Japonica Group]BAT04350.1 Os08g0216300 [Oryza sativa Japonica Group]|eukprot:NP_001175438.1 Os08g0214233 [Oryza sativa Japonica Group]
MYVFLACDVLGMHAIDRATHSAASLHAWRPERCHSQPLPAFVLLADKPCVFACFSFCFACARAPVCGSRANRCHGARIARRGAGDGGVHAFCGSVGMDTIKSATWERF